MSIDSGIILAGGTGTRLYPLTMLINKHLLPVYDRPMIYWPLQTFINAGITDIMIVSGREHAGQFLQMLGSGKELEIKLSYTVQEKAGGIADALSLCKRFSKGENIVVILGDNVFEDRFDFSDFGKKGEDARVYFKKVPEPWKFGVAKFKNWSNILGFEKPDLIDIVEKPEKGKESSNYAQTGLYIYNNSVFDIIDELIPSRRGELEITDVNNVYLRKEKLDYEIIKGEWFDAGSSFEDLYKASIFIRDKYKG